MALFEDSAEDEILRLRRIIEKLEALKATRLVTVEIVARTDRAGYLFYVSAPTVADEETFGLAMAQTIQRAFRKIGVQMDGPDLTSMNHLAPPKGRVQ